MFQYDSDWTEQDWRHEADARELAQLDADRRDMAETPCPEDLITLEDPAAKRYLAIGGVFLDDAGPINTIDDLIDPARILPKKKKEAA